MSSEAAVPLEDLGSEQALRSSTIEFGFEHVHPDNLDRGRLERAATGLADLPVSGNVRVVVTSQMDKSYSSRVAAAYSEPFQQSRIGVGRVTAKVVTDNSSSTEILVDALALLPGVRDHTDISLSRLLEHEGLHLVLRERGEDAHYLHRVVAEGRDRAEEALLWMGALTLEELRIERSLCLRGSFASERYDDEMPGIVDEYVAAFADLGISWGVSGRECASEALAMANDLMAKLAFVAGEQGVRPAVSEATTTGESWRIMVGPIWPELVEIGAAVPDALQEVEPPELQTLVARTAELARRSCEHIGFRLEDDCGLCVVPLHETAATGVTATVADAST